MICTLHSPGVQLSILNMGLDLYTEHMDQEETAQVSIACKTELKSLWDWFHVFRGARPDIVVFCCGWVWAFPLASVAAWLAGARRRFSIKHLFPPPVPRVEGRSLHIWQESAPCGRRESVGILLPQDNLREQRGPRSPGAGLSISSRQDYNDLQWRVSIEVRPV